MFTIQLIQQLVLVLIFDWPNGIPAEGEHLDDLLTTKGRAPQVGSQRKSIIGFSGGDCSETLSAGYITLLQ